MLNFLIAGLGGALGTMLRYAINSLIYVLLDAPLFPYGTFAVNVLGCFIIGLFAGLAESRAMLNPEMRVFVQIGILGGLTTFSSFGYETFALIRAGELLLGITNIVLQIAVGLTAIWVGYYLVQ